MKVSELVEKTGLTLFGGSAGLDREITGGYACDLLSDVMGHAVAGNLWITLQTHKNVIAIASLKELSAIILVKGFSPEEGFLLSAEQEGIPVLGTRKGTFDIVGKVYQLLEAK